MLSKRLVIAAVISAVTLIGLTGCSGSKPSDAAGTDTMVKQYRGEDLTCVRQGAIETKVITCDFAGFYAAHPGLLDHPEPAEGEKGTYWAKYKDQPSPATRKGRSRLGRCPATSSGTTPPIRPDPPSGTQPLDLS